MSITISIIEDLVEVREGLAQFLALNAEFSVLGAYASAEQALTELLVQHPDIVIMDINLPGMNGIECIRRVKDRMPGTQFMMFTVYENDEKVFEALKAGASGYLLKNTGLVQLIVALKELHEGGSPMSANIARKVVSLFQQQNKVPHQTTALSPRENEVLLLLSDGLLYKEIAEQLAISIATVRQHIHKIYDKLHVENRTEALNKVYGKKS